MSRTRSLFTATAIMVGSSAALLMGGIAKADPGPAPDPGSGLNPVQQFIASSVNAPSLLQNAASALTGIPATPATPAAPAAPPLGTSALVNLPQPATAGLQQPVVAGLPQPTAAAIPATGPAQLMPTAEIGLPTVPGFPTLLPQQMSLPNDLFSLLPGMPAPNRIPATTAATSATALPGAVTAPIAASALPDFTSLWPVSALP